MNYKKLTNCPLGEKEKWFIRKAKQKFVEEK